MEICVNKKREEHSLCTLTNETLHLVQVPQVVHTYQHDKHPNCSPTPAKSYVAVPYSLMIRLHIFIPSVQNRSGNRIT